MNSTADIDDLRQAYIDAFFALDDALTAAETVGSSSNMQRLDAAAVRLRECHRAYFAYKKDLRRTEQWRPAQPKRRDGSSSSPN